MEQIIPLTDYETGFNFTWYGPLSLLTGIGLFLMILNNAPLRTTLIFLLMFMFTNIVVTIAAIQDPDNRILQIFYDTPQQLSLGFYLGAILWYFLKTGSGLFGQQSILSVLTNLPTASILSVGKTGLTTAQSFFLNGVMAPFVEEIFFTFAVGAVIFFTAQQFDVSDIVAYIAALIGTSLAFASFHVNQPAFSSFWIAAIFFSVFVRGSGFFDEALDIVPFVAVNIGVFVGAHTVNNILELGGFAEFFSTLAGAPVLFGLTVGTYIVFLYWALQGVLNPGEY